MTKVRFFIMLCDGAESASRSLKRIYRYIKYRPKAPPTQNRVRELGYRPLSGATWIEAANYLSPQTCSYG